MALRTDEIQLRVLIDGSPARKELAELAVQESKLVDQLRQVKRGSEEAKQAMTELANVRGQQEALRKEIGLSALSLRELQGEAAKARAAFRSATPGTEQWVQAKARLDEVNLAMANLTKEANIQAATWDKVRGQYTLNRMSLAQLEQEANRLRASMRDLVPDTAEFTRLRSELTAVEGRMASVRSGLGPFGRAWENVKSQVMGAVAVLGGVFAIQGAINGFRQWIRSSAELSDAQAEVKRTTGLTASEVQRLTKELGQLNTRTARSELLDLAKEAGKLGITGVENVLAFVRAGDKLKVALGEELGDDAITQVGKLNQTFDIGAKTGKNMEQQMLSTGSALNDLANSSTASGAFIVDFTTRTAGAATQANLTMQEVMGFGAALDQLGLQSETSSTALGRFLIEAYKDSDKYARIAGLSTSAFLDLLKKNANEALLQVLEGLQGNNEGLATMAGLFDDLGQDGARAVSVLASLAKNTKLVREQQEVANRSFEKGTSVLEAFEQKNNTFAGNLEVIGKRLASAFVNSSFVNGVTALTRSLRDLIEVPVSEALEKERIAMNSLYAQILVTNEGSKERVELVRQLQAQYPGLLANMDAEKVTNEQLATAVEKLNDQLINKILLQQKDEELQKSLQEVATLRGERMQKESDALTLQTELLEKYGLRLKDIPALFRAIDPVANRLVPDPTTIQEQLQMTERVISNMVKQGKASFDDVIQLSDAILEASASKGLEKAQKRVADFIANQKALMQKAFGIDAGPTAGPGTTPTAEPELAPPTPGVPDVDKVQQDLERLREQIQQWRNQLFLDALSSDEREVAQVDQKYAELRAAILANEQHTAADLQALDEAHAQARANAIEAGGEKRLEAERKVQEKLRAEQQRAEDQVFLDKQSAGEREVAEAMQRFDEMVALYDAAGADTTELTERYERMIAAIRKKWRDKEKQEQLLARKERLDLFAGEAGEIAGAVGALNSTLAAFAAATGQRYYEQSLAAKSLAIFQIGLSSAAGLAKAIEAGAGIPWPGNLAAIASGSSAVLTGIASAMALFAKVPDPPPPPNQQGNGSAGPEDVPLGAQGGIFDGPSHAEGGLGVFDNRTGRQVAEVEGGEAWMVLSRNFTRNNANLIPALLAASKTGERIRWLAPPPMLNTGGIAHAMRMEAGGVVGKRHSRGTALVNLPTGDDSAMLADVLKELKQLNRTTANWPTRVKAITNLREDERDRAEYARLKARHSVRRS